LTQLTKVYQIVFSVLREHRSVDFVPDVHRGQTNTGRAEAAPFGVLSITRHGDSNVTGVALPPCCAQGKKYCQSKNPYGNSGCIFCDQLLEARIIAD